MSAGGDNIDISKAYDSGYADAEVHYETFARLAHFFGRDMHAHWHDRYFQLHYLATGKITLQLDDHLYDVCAPLFILTPPSVPHAFITEADSDGHVLTVRQELVWSLAEKLWPDQADTINRAGVCLSLAASPLTLAALDHYWPLIAAEFSGAAAGRELALNALAQALFTLLLREAPPWEHGPCGVRGEMRQFQRFNRMIDQHYRQHLAVPDYARELGVSESRLTGLCRRFANQSPKRLIFERVLREAKRLLRYSSDSVHQIAWALGYKDPAYFARFFHRMAGCSPSEFRNR